MTLSQEGLTQMKVLFIGGTGQISSAIVRKLAKEKDYEVWLLNRGNRPAPEGAGLCFCSSGGIPGGSGI